MIDFNECVRLGLLRKIPPSRNQAKEQLEKAKILLEEAKKSIEIESPNSAVIAGYSAMLDAARAILFRDGYREKSHACVARYLEAKYLDSIGLTMIALLDQYRDQRHKTMYSGEYYPTTEEAKNVVEFSEKFVRKVEKLLSL